MNPKPQQSASMLTLVTMMLDGLTRKYKLKLSDP